MYTHRGKLLYVLVGDAQWGEANLLRELSEVGVSQHGHVTQQLMDAVSEMVGTEYSTRLTRYSYRKLKALEATYTFIGEINVVNHSWRVFDIECMCSAHLYHIQLPK